MANEIGSRRRGPWAWRAVLLGLAAALALFGVGRHVAQPGQAVEFELTFARGGSGVVHPLIVTGRTDAADFLLFEFRDERRGVFLYDSWGQQNLTSEEVEAAPGRVLRVRVEMPSLGRIKTGRDADVRSGRLRVVCDGRVVLDRMVESHARGVRQLYFGFNPVGGGSGTAVLDGGMRDASGRQMRGSVGEPRRLEQRVLGWLRHEPWQVLCVALLAWGGWRLAPRAAGVSTGGARAALAGFGREHRVFIGLTAASATLFAWMVTYGTFNFREGTGILTDFYDFQMASLLQGRLDVPEAGIGGEAFVWHGRLYGYFGMTPALLRFPMIVFDVAFGQWSRVLIVAWFIGALTGAYLLLRDAVAVLGGAGRKPSPAAVALLTVLAGLGSTLFFLSARSYVYHEAILCGAMLALFACWCAGRHLRAPDGRWWMAALLCGTLAVHARPTIGLYALAFLGWVSAEHVIAAARAARAGASWAAVRRPLGIGGLVVVGALTFNLQAYLKFGTFDGAPLAINRAYNPERIAAIKSKNMHLANIPFNFYSYVAYPNLRFEARFPWIFLNATGPRRDFPRAKMDLPDATLAMPYSMPALCLLATAGAALVAWRRRAARDALVVTWLALAAPAFILLTAIATAHRYTGDFCPFLIAAAVWPLAALDGVGRFWRGAGFGALAVLAAWSVALTFAFTLHYQRAVVWGVPEEVRMEYRRWQERFATPWGLDEGLLQRGPGAPPR